MADRKMLLESLTERVFAIRAEIGERWPSLWDPDIAKWELAEEPDNLAGYWIELLRLAGERRDDWSLYEDAARRMARLRPVLYEHLGVFPEMFFYGAARLYETLSDRMSRTLALAAAYGVRASSLGISGSWVVQSPQDPAPRLLVLADTAHRGLLLDWWALEETGDATFLDGAERHLDLIIRDFAQEDGSIAPSAFYDPETLDLIEVNPGPAEEIHRSQIGAIAGLLRGWETTREPRFIAPAAAAFAHWRRSWGDAVLQARGTEDASFTASEVAHQAAPLAEAIARLAVIEPRPDEVAPFLDQLDPLIDAVSRHAMPGDGEPGGDLTVLYHLFAALHCLDVGELPC
jgi:hypothetical protein